MAATRRERILAIWSLDARKAGLFGGTVIAHVARPLETEGLLVARQTVEYLQIDERASETQSRESNCNF
jgi:hypothetical protein